MSRRSIKTRSRNKKEPSVLIHVDGVQGSGKSYICSKLKNVVCIDTDDIMEQTKKIVCNILGRDFPAKINKTTLKLIQREETKIVQKYIDKNAIVVFVGMTVKIPNPTYKFFIKINDPETVYKRLLLRELEKIVSNHKKIQIYIKHTNPKEMRIAAVSKQAVPFGFVSFDEFLEDYKERIQEAKTQKYLIKTQDQIIDFINKL